MGLPMSERVRIDKWLWAARFFKTRAVASEAVGGGKVHINEQRAKPSREVRVGDILSITRGLDEFKVEVKALSIRRGPAADAQLLYEESEESQQQREQRQQERKLHAQAIPIRDGKPNNRDRRIMDRLRGR